MKAYHAELCRLDPKIGASYTYANFEEHVKACTVAFWLFIFGFCHTSSVASSLSGEMDKDKMEYTWQKFMPGCLALMGAATTELGIIKYQEELLAEGPCAAELKARETFLQANYPKAVGDITADWLAALLETDVTGMEVIKVLEAGVTSDAVIVGLTYGAGAGGPASICLKYAKGTQEGRDFAMGGNMYKKELFFFKNLHKEVSSVMSIPKMVGVLIDEDKPEEFFCIAMEDLLPTCDPVDQITGLSVAEAANLADMAAAFHANFWEAPVLKDDIVCAGKPDACAVFFEGWAMATLVTPGQWDKYVGLCRKRCQVDNEPTPADTEACKLLHKYPNELFASFHAVLDTRPKTLTHGDMRADNMFRKKDGSGFTVIDWQTYGASSPGIEMHQLFANTLKTEADYEQLPALMKGYLATLHKLQPASKGYTFEMLWEDFRIGAAMGNVCMATALCGLLETLPDDHQNFKLFKEAFFPRNRWCYTALDIAGVVLDHAKKLGLSLDSGRTALSSDSGLDIGMGAI
jgi:hypothetical protein